MPKFSPAMTLLQNEPGEFRLSQGDLKSVRPFTAARYATVATAACQRDPAGRKTNPDNSRFGKHQPLKGICHTPDVVESLRAKQTHFPKVARATPATPEITKRKRGIRIITPADADMSLCAAPSDRPRALGRKTKAGNSDYATKDASAQHKHGSRVQVAGVADEAPAKLAASPKKDPKSLDKT